MITLGQAINMNIRVMRNYGILRYLTIQLIRKCYETYGGETIVVDDERMNENNSL